ncbi:hypothetical protein D3C77_735060 [compost metagenome]
MCIPSLLYPISLIMQVICPLRHLLRPTVHVAAFTNNAHPVYNTDLPIWKRLLQRINRQLVRLLGCSAEDRQNNAAIHEIKIQIA